MEIVWLLIRILDQNLFSKKPPSQIRECNGVKIKLYCILGIDFGGCITLDSSAYSGN